MLLLPASRQLVATLVAVIIAFSLTTLIIQGAKYKISLHVDSAADMVMVWCLLVSLIDLLLLPLVVLIAWARWKLEERTSLQAIGRATLAIAVTATMF
ncbi:hypothetical protein KSX_69810 [Ktedonospora formicarum]|uniref:Uncharacterized protein n=1 Tax=Ktedonospora formicarum TaxID=2778364 RepID=A0A8J3I7Z0_9CHLR|nr:hypothetical protein KSX_69810 [Ktedonospora formicarum]